MMTEGNQYGPPKSLQNTNGNTYPTHGLGPLAHLLNIHRGDKFTHLVSMSSDQFGLTKYYNEKLNESHNWEGNSFSKGDMNTTLLAILFDIFFKI